MNRVLFAIMLLLGVAFALVVTGDVAKAQCGSQQLSSFNVNASATPVQQVGLLGRFRSGGGCGSGGCGQSSQSSIRVERQFSSAAPVVAPQNQSSFRMRVEQQQGGGCATGNCEKQSSSLDAETANKLAQALESVSDTLKDVESRLSSVERHREFQTETVAWAPQHSRSFQMEFQSSGTGYGAASRAALWGRPYRQPATPIRDALQAAAAGRQAHRAERELQRDINRLTAPVYGY